MAKINRVGIILVLAFVLRSVIVLLGSFHPDLVNHFDWGEKYWTLGPKNFYENIFWASSWPNQPPVSILLFAVLSKLYHFVFTFLWKLNLALPVFPSFLFPFFETNLKIYIFKLPFILADLGVAWLVYKFVLFFTTPKNKKMATLALIVSLFNPVLIYNSTVWGQTDSLINFLALGSILLFLTKKYFFAFLLFWLSLYIKLSMLIWAPLFLVLLIWYFKDFKRMVLAAITSIVLVQVLILPFVHHGNLLSWNLYMFENRIFNRQGNMLCGNAFNLWALFRGVDLSLPKNTPFFGVSANTIGTCFTGLGVWLVTYLACKKPHKPHTLLWLMVLLCFTSFLFLTNMHERYLYPVFAPLLVLTVTKQISWHVYATVSVVHLLNLYHLWWYPSVPFIQTLFAFGSFVFVRILSFVLLLMFGYIAVQYIQRVKNG